MLPVGEPTPVNDPMEMKTGFLFVNPNDTPNGTYLSRNELFRNRSMHRKLAYKVKATFGNVVFLLAKCGWLVTIEPEIRGDTGTIIGKAYDAFETVTEIGSNYAVMLAACINAAAGVATTVVIAAAGAVFASAVIAACVTTSKTEERVGGISARRFPALASHEQPRAIPDVEKEADLAKLLGRWARQYAQP